MSLGFLETLILIGIVILVFGSGRLPGAVRDIGRGFRVFRDELRTPAPSSTASGPASEPDAAPGRGAHAADRSPDGRTPPMIDITPTVVRVDTASSPDAGKR